MEGTKIKYQLGTEENQAFMKKIRDDLLNFGHKFPSPGKTETVKPGLPAV